MNSKFEAILKMIETNLQLFLEMTEGEQTKTERTFAYGILGMIKTYRSCWA